MVVAVAVAEEAGVVVGGVWVLAVRFGSDFSVHWACGF